MADSRKRKPSNEKVINGYVLNVSPIKSAKKSNKPYFNLDLETEGTVKQVICFSPSKRKLFIDARDGGEGCEIKQASVKDENTIFVSDYSSIRIKELGFPQRNNYHFKSVIDVINEVPLDEIINVKGVVELANVRQIIRDDGEVYIREGHLIDDTGSIKITLWREYCNIDNRTTYDFIHLQKVRYAGEIIVQSVFNTTFTRSDIQIEDFQAPAPTPELVLNGTRILAISSNESEYCCICKAPARPDEEEKVYLCNNCRSIMLRSTLTKKVTRKFTVSVDGKRSVLNCKESLIQMAFPEKRIVDMDSQQLVILLLNQRFDITYDNNSMNICTIVPTL